MTLMISAVFFGFMAACTERPYPSNPRSRSVDRGTRLAKVERLSEQVRLEFPGVPRVQPAEVEPETLLIDCREPHERAVSVLPGRVVTAEAFEHEPSRYVWAGKDQAIVIYCTIGARSSRYVKELKERGFSVRNLKGGVLGWAHAGLDFVDPSGNHTRRVHVYGETWDLLPPGYESVY